MQRICAHPNFWCAIRTPSQWHGRGPSSVTNYFGSSRKRKFCSVTCPHKRETCHTSVVGSTDFGKKTFVSILYNRNVIGLEWGPYLEVWRFRVTKKHCPICEKRQSAIEAMLFQIWRPSNYIEQFFKFCYNKNWKLQNVSSPSIFAKFTALDKSSPRSSPLNTSLGESLKLSHKMRRNGHNKMSIIERRGISTKPLFSHVQRVLIAPTRFPK